MQGNMYFKWKNAGTEMVPQGSSKQLDRLMIANLMKHSVVSDLVPDQSHLDIRYYIVDLGN
jgi:hypothetical protein